MGNNPERRVRVGSTVSVRWADQNETEEYTIVPAHEADWQRAMISEACPFGQAVLGRLPGETVSIKVNGQQCRVTIVDISDSSSELTTPTR
jgi:transcription elongation GreA/GreB family factor